MRAYTPFERDMRIEVTDVHDDGITLQGNYYSEFNNVYGIAHGGYLYTLAHLACELTGELCVGGVWEVRHAECLYLHPLRQYPATVKTTLLGKQPEPMVRAEVYDRNGALCFEVCGALGTKQQREKAQPHTPTIFSDRPLPKTPYEEPVFPCRTSTFSRWLNIYSTSKTEESIVYSADLNERNCDEFGYLLPAAIFTASDCAAGGCLFYIDKKSPLTASASVHFMQPTCCGPVHAVPRPVRKGKILNFYDVDVIDGNGTLVAVAQFIMRDRDYK